LKLKQLCKTTYSEVLENGGDENSGGEYYTDGDGGAGICLEEVHIFLSLET
jgi:hypothetical protein